MELFVNLFLLAIVMTALPGLAVLCLKAGLQGEPLGYLLGVLFAVCVIVGIVKIPQQFQIAKIILAAPGAAVALYAYRQGIH